MSAQYTRCLVLSLIAVLMPAAAVRAQNATRPPAQPLGLTAWTPGRIPGSTRMLLVGDPATHGLFAARFRYPDGARIAPHWHTASVHITVLAGTLMLGMGDVFDSTHAQAYGPGSFLVLEGGMHHYEWFRGEVTVHVEGIGPFRTAVLNRGPPNKRLKLAARVD